jgi:hypothetical protein
MKALVLPITINSSYLTQIHAHCTSHNNEILGSWRSTVRLVIPRVFIYGTGKNRNQHESLPTNCLTYLSTDKISQCLVKVATGVPLLWWSSCDPPIVPRLLKCGLGTQTLTLLDRLLELMGSMIQREFPPRYLTLVSGLCVTSE